MNAVRYYAGIGSRRTPNNVLAIMSEFAVKAANRGFVLRSGGANGADKAFEAGCDLVGGKKEIYLPWKKFNDSESSFFQLSDSALLSVDKYHPSPLSLTLGARKLMARNYQQVLGDGHWPVPVTFVLCWTQGDLNSGGTSQALRIAIDHGVPYFNLASGDANEIAKMVCINILGSTWGNP